MPTNTEVYQNGGSPSNGQVASVRVGTVDLSTLNEGVGTAIGDVINMFDIDANEVVIAAGWEVLEATAATVTLDIGIDGDASFGSAEVGTVVTALAADTVPALGTAGVVTVEVNVAASAVGRIKVWCVVALVDDPAEPVPASVRVPPIV